MFQKPSNNYTYLTLGGIQRKVRDKRSCKGNFCIVFGNWAMIHLANNLCIPIPSPHHSWPYWCPRSMKFAKFQPLVPTQHSYNSQVIEPLIPSPEYCEDSWNLWCDYHLLWTFKEACDKQSQCTIHLSITPASNLKYLTGLANSHLLRAKNYLLGAHKKRILISLTVLHVCVPGG